VSGVLKRSVPRSAAVNRDGIRQRRRSLVAGIVGRAGTTPLARTGLVTSSTPATASFCRGVVLLSPYAIGASVTGPIVRGHIGTDHSSQGITAAQAVPALRA
jgi:hypothetical protein